jgi:TRAP-type C4-dicarboxylate transport system substrate-binding protein
MLMKIKLRLLALAPVVAGLLWCGLSPLAQAADAKVIKISHQFPGGTIDKGDFRDRLVRKFAQEVEKRTNGQLKFEVYPGGSLVKTMQQLDSLSVGALDMTLYPLAYSGGKIPEVNITLMPALITSYDQGYRWKNAPVGKELTRILDEHNVKIVTWIWQAGGGVSRDKAILVPEDTKGLKVRGAGKSMDEMLKAAGGSITNVPSDETYSAMQSGVLDGVWTSSASLVSFRLYELGKHVTTARDKTFWFMFEPLLMAKATYDSLTPAQQKIVMEVGASLEKFAIQSCKEDDKALAEVYGKAGAKVHDMDEKTFLMWRKLAKESAWKNFEDNVKDGKKLMEMAEAVK